MQLPPGTAPGARLVSGTTRWFRLSNQGLAASPASASSALPFGEESVIFLKLVSGIAGGESLVDPACLRIQAVAKESGRSQKSTSATRERQGKINHSVACVCWGK